MAREIVPKPLPEEYTIPQPSWQAIEANLGSYVDKAAVVTLRGADYLPDEEWEEVCRWNDAIVMARTAGLINIDEAQVYFNDLNEQSEEGAPKNLVRQLQDIFEITNLFNTYQVKEARRIFIEDFCPKYQIDPDKVVSVFQSLVEHPSAQASIINLMARANRSISTEGTHSLVLGIRWHL